MKTLSKTQRQMREYKRSVGFNMIKNKYENCHERLYDEDRKISVVSLNSEFLNYSKSMKNKYGMVLKHKNKYENKWNNEVNKIKKN